MALAQQPQPNYRLRDRESLSQRVFAVDTSAIYTGTLHTLITKKYPSSPKERKEEKPRETSLYIPSKFTNQKSSAFSCEPIRYPQTDLLVVQNTRITKIKMTSQEVFVFLLSNIVIVDKNKSNYTIKIKQHSIERRIMSKLTSFGIYGVIVHLCPKAQMNYCIQRRATKPSLSHHRPIHSSTVVNLQIAFAASP